MKLDYEAVLEALKIGLKNTRRVRQVWDGEETLHLGLDEDEGRIRWVIDHVRAQQKSQKENGS